MTDSKEIRDRTPESRNRLPSQIGELAEPKSGDLEIPPKEWESFLESFSLQHEGWLGRLSVAHGSKAPIETSNCRLQRIAIDCVAKKCTVNISVLEGGKLHIHSVPDPVRLIFKRDASGAHEGLETASADGTNTLLRFRVAAHPETLDGVLPDFGRQQANG